MGVPSFYRWLVDKYPKIVANVVEDKTEEIDSCLPNLNGIEFDNLYLDMNGIIHPCFHPPHHHTIKQPTTFEDVFDGIYEYIDRLFAIVRPRKLLYLAIDGVAPRAKINQQRSRRFRNAKDNAFAEAEEDRLRLEFEKEGKLVLPKDKSDLLDSNIVTPGTEFMFKLSKALGRYVRTRLETDPGWRNIIVILSDANVPGEGEHKIMSFIRDQRSSPQYNPNTRHCLYGLDADLIMLALATHELHFSILREDLQHANVAPSTSESGLADVLTKADSSKPRGFRSNRSTSMYKMPFQFVHIWILREYLDLDMRVNELPDNVEMDVERIIDDFVFMCCFIGNDFLPRMPTLRMHEGAMDLLMTVYKKEFKKLGGYLVDMERIADRKMGFIKLKRVEKFMLAVGTYEEKIFQKRSELQERNVRRVLYEKANEEVELASSDHDLGSISHEYPSNDVESFDHYDPAKILENTKVFQEKLKNCLRLNGDLHKNGLLPTDKVRLGTFGWKERYYKVKLSAESPEQIENTRRKIVEKYTEGLIWVLKYYYSGVQSWTWFYPYHYGPFASDLEGLARVKVKFEKGAPFNPFDQLMGTLPPKSAHALPKSYQQLMIDEKSSIIDFYPEDFEIDTDGVRFVWQGTSKLPFIEESRLLAETKNLEKDLGPEEAIRNAIADAQMFLRSSTELGAQITESVQKQASDDTKQGAITIDNTSLSGLVCPCLEDIDNLDWNTNVQEIREGSILCCMFYKHHSDCRPHIPRLLSDVEYPDKTVSEEDVMDTVLWHEILGNRAPQRSYNHYQSRKESYKVTPSSASFREVHVEGHSSGWIGRGNTGSNEGNSARRRENMRITDPNQSSGSYGRSMPSNNNNLWKPSSLGRGKGELRGSTETMSHSSQHDLRSTVSHPQQSRGREQIWVRGGATTCSPRGPQQSRGREQIWVRGGATTCSPRGSSHSSAETKNRW